MCSVLISEQEVSQVDTATLIITFSALTKTVDASGILITRVADDDKYSRNTKT